MNKKLVITTIPLIIILLIAFAMIPLRDYGIYARSTRGALAHPSYLYTDYIDGFYCLPWTIFILTPFSFLPDYIGQAVLNLISITGVVSALKILCPYDDLLSFSLALASPSLLCIVYLGQWDAVAFGAAALAYWAFQQKRMLLFGLLTMIALTKPTNVILLVGILLLKLLRQRIQHVSIAMIVPCFLGIASFVTFGIDWPGRYIAYTQQTPPFGYSISIWSSHTYTPLFPCLAILLIASLFTLCWKKELSPSSIALLLVANLLLSPYLTPYGVISLAPALGIIAFHYKILGIIMYLLGLCSYVLFFYNQQHTLPMYSYVLLCFIVLFWMVQRDLIEAATPESERYKSVFL